MKRLSYIYDDYLFHFLIERNPIDTRISSQLSFKFQAAGLPKFGTHNSPIVYMVLSDARLGRRVPFAFLDDLRQEFRQKFPQIPSEMEMKSNSSTLPLQAEFKSGIKDKLYLYNSGDGDTLTKVRS